MSASAPSDTNSLTGVWHGQFDYPVAYEPVSFVATLMDIAGQLSGTTHETGKAGGTAPARQMAMLSGARNGDHVRFLKTYAPASEEFQDVIYDGVLNADRTEISGNWLIPGEWGGRFMMIRARSATKAKARRKRAEV